MKWPWQPKADNGSLAIGTPVEALAWVQADAAGRLLRCGLELRGSDNAADFSRRVRALGLPPTPATAVLRLAEAQLLQVEAPAVKPEELKAAARWRIKDMIDSPLDELTVDVLQVGDERARSHRQLFVAAARNAVIRDTADRTHAAGLTLAAIDIAETTQRNLQTAIARAEGLGERATAALMLHGKQCLLTVCAGGELFYARRLPWDEHTLEAVMPRAPALPPAAAMENLDFVDYGAETGGAADDGGVPPLVIELQRSFDLLERSWPEIAVAGLWVHVGAGSPALARLLHDTLGLRVEPLDPERVFPGFDALAAGPGVREAVLPLLGGLLRVQSRQL